jgi:hypothetical protein
MKREDAKNLFFWFGNQLLEEVVDYFSQQVPVPRDEKRGCKKSCLVWKLLKRVGDSYSQKALKHSVPGHEKKGCKKSGLYGLETNS